MTYEEKNAAGCAGCRFASPVYMGDGEELMCACVYILRTGKRRPCPPGPGCLVREPAGEERPGGGMREAIAADVHARA